MPLRRSQIYSDKNPYIEIMRSDANVLSRNQFVAVTDLRRVKAQSLDKLLNRTHEKNLQQRRERLRDLLSTEATLYQQELITDWKIKAEEDFKTRENRLLGLKAERERQRLKFVEEMRVQQLINGCDEIRPHLRRKLQDECKNCQQLQIEDNNLKRIEQRDQDRLWHEVQNKVFHQMKQRELEESLVARNRHLKDEQILRKQMLEKDEVTKEVEYEEDTMHCGKVFGNAINEQELLIQNKEKQHRFAQDLLTQQIEKDVAKKTLKNCERLNEMALIDVSEKEMRKSQQNARLEKKRNMKETLQFLGYLKNVDNEKTMAERESEILTENIRKEKNEEYLRNREFFHHQRDEFNKSIYEERWKQIMDRRHKLLQEKNQKINEIIEANEIFANNAYMERELLIKKKNSRLQYGRELRAQCNHKKIEKDNSATSSKILTEIIDKDETQKSEVIKNNLGRIHEIYPLHPNCKALLNSDS